MNKDFITNSKYRGFSVENNKVTHWCSVLYDAYKSDDTIQQKVRKLKKKFDRLDFGVSIEDYVCECTDIIGLQGESTFAQVVKFAIQYPLVQGSTELIGVLQRRSKDKPPKYYDCNGEGLPYEYNVSKWLGLKDKIDLQTLHFRNVNLICILRDVDTDEMRLVPFQFLGTDDYSYEWEWETVRQIVSAMDCFASVTHYAPVSIKLAYTLAHALYGVKGKLVAEDRLNICHKVLWSLLYTNGELDYDTIGLLRQGGFDFNADDSYALLDNLNDEQYMLISKQIKEAKAIVTQPGYVTDPTAVWTNKMAIEIFLNTLQQYEKADVIAFKDLMGVQLVIEEVQAVLERKF